MKIRLKHETWNWPSDYLFVSGHGRLQLISEFYKCPSFRILRLFVDVELLHQILDVTSEMFDRFHSVLEIATNQLENYDFVPIFTGIIFNSCEFLNTASSFS